MSFTYKEIRRLVRFKEKDNNEIKFSDYDIKMAVNEVIRYLSLSLADSNGDFNEKIKVYDEKEFNEQLKAETPEEDPEDSEAGEEFTPISFRVDGVELPEDFISLVSIKGRPFDPRPLEPCLSMNRPLPWQYKIVGDKLYVGAPHFDLVYKAGIAEVKEEEDEIELPYMFKDNFVQLVRMIINGAEVDIMRDAIDNAVQELIPKRRYRNAKISMPFKIGW